MIHHRIQELGLLLIRNLLHFYLYMNAKIRCFHAKLYVKEKKTKMLCYLLSSFTRQANLRMPRIDVT